MKKRIARLKRPGLLECSLLAALLVVPFLSSSGYHLHLAIMSFIFALHTLGVNIISGLTGLMSLGQAGFYAIGAYGSAVLAMRLGVPTWLAVPMAGLLATLVGLLVALPVLRLKGIYLGMATYGFGKIVYVMAQNWESVTHGTYGLTRIPPLEILGLKIVEPLHFYYVALAILVVFVLISARIRYSSVGEAMIAIGEDELAAEFNGIDTVKYKVIAFALGAGFSGIAGGLFAHYLSYASPEHFTSTVSLQILTMLIVGGRGYILGAVSGAGLLIVLPEVLRMVPQARLLMYGILLVSMSVLRPQGILGGIHILRPSPPGVSANNNPDNELTVTDAQSGEEV